MISGHEVRHRGKNGRKKYTLFWTDRYYPGGVGPGQRGSPPGIPLEIRRWQGRDILEHPTALKCPGFLIAGMPVVRSFLLDDPGV